MMITFLLKFDVIQLVFNVTQAKVNHICNIQNHINGDQTTQLCLLNTYKYVQQYY